MAKLINYKIQNFQVLIGDLDITSLIVRIELSRPIHELRQWLTWTGELELSWVLSSGITESQINQFTNPSYFRPFQKQCRLSIIGATVCIFYLEDYIYDPVTKIGKSKIVQILDIPKSRPAKEVLKQLSDFGTKLGTVITNLLNYAFENSSIPTPSFVFNPNNHTGTYDDRLTSRDPIKDAQDLSSKNYRWLYVDTLNRIADVQGDPNGNLNIFARPLSQVEISPVYDHVHFAANQFIITGTKKQIKKEEFGGYQIVFKTEEDKDTFDQEGRQLKLVTYTFKKKWEIFPELSTTTTTINGKTQLQITDTSDIVYERKVIEYYYWNVNPPYPTLETFRPVNPIGGVTDTSAAIPQIYTFANKWKQGDLVATVTTIQRIGGALYPVNVGTPQREFDTGLRFFQQIIETPYCKITYQCKGLVDIQLSGTTNIVPDDSPVLIGSEPITGGRIDPDGTVPGQTNKKGQTLEFTTQLPLENRNEKPDLDLEEITLTGKANFSPVGWTPVRNDPYVEEIGFIPDQFHADQLAYQIGWRECRRRDSWYVQMPVPNEWLSVGCRPLQNCVINNLVLQIDEEIISIENEEMKYAFTGNTIGFAASPVPEPPEETPFVPGQAITLTSSQSYVLVTNSEINIQFSVFGGSAPYTYSQTGLLAELNLSSSGLLTGTPLTPGINTVNLTVNDSASNSLTIPITIVIVADKPATVPVLGNSELEDGCINDGSVEIIVNILDGSVTDANLGDSVVFSPVTDGGITDAVVVFTASSDLSDGFVADATVIAQTTLTDGTRTDHNFTTQPSVTTGLSDGTRTDHATTQPSTTSGTTDGTRTDGSQG